MADLFDPLASLTNDRASQLLGGVGRTECVRHWEITCGSTV